MKNVALPRKFFGRRREILDPPYLLGVPKASFEDFIQLRKAPHERENKGLEYIFRTSFPFTDPDGNVSLEYIGYEIGDWECNICGFKPESDFLAGWGVKCPNCGGTLSYREKYTPEECKVKGLTYSAPLRVMFRLKLKTKGGERIVSQRKVYFGEVPLMTEWGSFIINGSERVIVNQLIRSTGVFFEEKEDKQKDATITRIIYRASIIPDKGSRIEFELSGTTDLFSARIDKKKASGIAILRAWGFETAYEILSSFYEGVRKLIPRGSVLFDAHTGEEYRPEDLEHHYIFAILRYRAKLEEAHKEKEFIEERYVEDWENLELLLGDERIKVESVTVVPYERAVKSAYAKIVVDTLIAETTPREPDKMSQVKVPAEFSFRDYGYMEIYKKLRLVETMTMEIENLIERARAYFENFFKHITRYDLSKVGRVKINAKVHKLPKTLKPSDLDLLDNLPPVALAEDVGKFKEGTKLTKEILKNLFKSKKVKEVKIKDYTEEEARFILPVDLINILKHLINLRFRKERKDDVAHLGNRRVRSVGELLENQVRSGIAKMEKAFRDRVAVVNPEDPNLKPQDLINPRYVTNSIVEFLKGGQLSQYLDNTNPLSALTHKRRLSALGPGGLTRESAKFEIRDVHPSHYGRICPIETPEGQNIGLVTSMTVYAQVNEYGFLITP
ncbi:MAG TPA: DNA-directed RNA polymerase subunit beta, partial [Aquifex aeolicus]|nr:DNA-directed RNA polymerase subunit beta [Aquifex aeolicus]